MKGLMILATLLVVGSSKRIRVRRDATPEPVYMQVEKCKKLHEAGATVANCPQMTTCYQQLLTKATECYKQEMENPKQKECSEKQEVKDAKKKYFESGCAYHTAVGGCMAGGEPSETEYGSILSSPDTTMDHTHAPHEHKKHDEMKHPEKCCWGDMHKELKKCFETAAAACPNLKTCAGKEKPANADDALGKWYRISHHLKKEKKREMRNFMKEVMQCIAA